MINTKNWFQLRPMYSYIKKQAENEKFLRYLEVGGTFTLIAIFLFFAIMPTMTTISSLLGEIKSKEAYIEKVNKKVASVLKAQDSYSQVQEKFYLIEESFPSMAQYYNGATNLTTMFNESSINIKQLNLNLEEEPVSKNNKDKFYKTYDVNLAGEGQYSAVMEMLNKLINNRRLMSPTNIQFTQIKTPEGTRADTDNIRINISSSLYFLPNNNEKK